MITLCHPDVRKKVLGGARSSALDHPVFVRKMRCEGTNLVWKIPLAPLRGSKLLRTICSRRGPRHVVRKKGSNPGSNQHLGGGNRPTFGGDSPLKAACLLAMIKLPLNEKFMRYREPLQAFTWVRNKMLGEMWLNLADVFADFICGISHETGL